MGALGTVIDRDRLSSRDDGRIFDRARYVYHIAWT